MVARDAIVIVAKHPEPGRVKTRLCPALTPVQAADLAKAFFLDTLAAARAVPDAEVLIGYAPHSESARNWFEDSAPGHGLLPQGDGDLGERLISLLHRSFQRGFDRVALIGSDMPQIDSRNIRVALDAIGEGADISIGPAEDGGYYLLAVDRLHPELFDQMPWGTGSLLAATLAAAARLGLRITSLPIGRDIDLPDDLVALSDSARPAHTDLALRRFASIECASAATHV